MGKGYIESLEQIDGIIKRNNNRVRLELLKGITEYVLDKRTDVISQNDNDPFCSGRELGYTDVLEYLAELNSKYE